jgi:hypothetical protein
VPAKSTDAAPTVTATDLAEARELIERVFPPSRIRRGRDRSNPVFKVGGLYFGRRKDAQRFVDNGCNDPDHVKLTEPRMFTCAGCWGANWT